MEQPSSNRPPNLEEKLHAILKSIRCEGYAIMQSSSRLADKVSGSIPSGGEPEANKPIIDNAHSVVDDIGRELGRVFGFTAQELDRAHCAFGEFGRDKTLRAPDVAYQTEAVQGIAKQSRW